MENTKTVSSFKRLACAFLALVTVLVAIPLLTVKTEATVVKSDYSVVYDFEGQIAGSRNTGEDPKGNWEVGVDVRGSSAPPARRESTSRVLFCHSLEDHLLHFPRAKMQPMTKRSQWSP